jgi:hypothetical protein
VSTGHIVNTSSLRFHLTLFVRTYGEDAELSFDFEAEDIYAAGDKVLEVSRRISECPGVLYWKILSVVQIRTAGPQRLTGNPGQGSKPCTMNRWS